MEQARNRPVASAVAALVLLAAVMSLIVPDLGESVGVLGVTMGQVGAAVVGISGARRLQGDERRAWLAIFATFAFGSIGVITTGLLSEVFGQDVPAYSWVDLIFIAGYISLIYGIFNLPTAARRGSARLRIIVDAAVGVISVAVLSWVWFLDDVAHAFLEADVWQRVVGLAYPLLDIVAIVILMTVFIRKRHEVIDVRLVLLSLGLLFQSIADTSLASVAAGGGLDEAQPIFWLFASASFFYLLAAIWSSAPQTRLQASERSPSVWPLFVPYGIAVVLLATLIVRAIDMGLGPDVMWLMLGVAAVGLLMAVRQIASIRDLAVTVEMERRALIASVSHELRTPLTAMIGFLEVLEDPALDLPPEEAREFLVMIGQQSRYLARIVNDLTMLARVGQESVDLDVAEIEFDVVVARVRDSLEIDTTAFEVDAPVGLRLMVDGERLQQILLNLVTNATRYGGEDVVVAAVVNGNDVTIEVHDSGGGVPARYQYTMWERFNRGAHHLNATVPGSGIGLAIVKALSEAHGGKASYRQSDRLGGACFAVDLPRALASTSTKSPTGVSHQPAERSVALMEPNTADRA